jgi:hypothetical protein
VNPAPSIGGFKLSPKRFRAAPRKGTTISFSLSSASRVTISFERAKKNHTYVKVRGQLSVNAASGKGKVRFLGKLGGRRLAPGAYRVSAVAAASGRASAVRRAQATVLR